MWLMVILYSGTLVAGQVQVVPYQTEMACKSAQAQKEHFFGDGAKTLCYYDDEIVRFFDSNVRK